MSSLLDIGGGLTLGLTTLYSLYLNSMLLGVLSAAWPTSQQLSGAYWSLILPHAVIELTPFTICAGAGLSLAAVVIRAGSVPRQRHRLAGRRAAMIGVGTMPLLIIAGTIEGFVTPSALPIAVKLAVAPATAVLLAAYLRRGRRVTRV